MKCYFESDAYQKFRNFIDNSDSEISGFGKSEIRDGDIFVSDIILFKQKNSLTGTILDGDDMALWLNELRKNGENPSDWNVWWHSHYTMDVFWSSTDKKCMEELNYLPYLLSIVGNQDRKVLTRLDVNLTDTYELGLKTRKEKDNIDTQILYPKLTGKSKTNVSSLDKDISSLEKQLESINNKLEKVSKKKDDIYSKHINFEEIKEWCLNEIDEKIEKPTQVTNFGKKNFYGNRETYEEKGFCNNDAYFDLQCDKLFLDKKNNILSGESYFDDDSYLTKYYNK